MTDIAVSRPVRLRRSLLSVPAINRRALEKARGLACDGVIFDLEDSVAPEKKQEARDNLAGFFAAGRLAGREHVIRINALASAFGRLDMETVIALAPDAVLIPKVDGPEDVLAVADLLDEAGAAAGIEVWAMMETPRGVLNAAAIAGTGTARLGAFVVGLNDLRKDTGVPMEPGRTFLIPWLMQVVLAARAYGVEVIDSVSNDFRDLDAFAAECRQGRGMGFDGKMLIHPAQIEASNRHFSPDAADVAEAEAIIAAFADPAAAGLNVLTVNGRMVERLHIEPAVRLAAKARLAAERENRTT
ncbi:CoA ester lyase [Rhizobiaceae bacterium BDR2-2]|uniref:CoA ester lyase n=1 Tax=Ectorhizobium quercum TaxID=2965071 RepID=A0AAE3N2S7_9HYPH|nr:CoA ester lyase [Ectorhizobium quercum]MCX8999529.1 CoA ester lyase [Ectorhizobium quercum]